MTDVTKTPEILQVDAINGLEVATRDAIQKAFLPFAEQFAEWETKAKEIIVTDITETDKMKAAGEARKAIKKIRTGADAIRKSLKEDSLRYGKAVQEVYNKIEAGCEGIEKHLEAQERFIELEEAKRRELVIAERMDLLKDFSHVTSDMVIALDDENFQVLLDGLIAQKKRKEDELKKEEEEEIARQRVIDLHHDRRSEMMEEGIWMYLDVESQSQNFGLMIEADYQAYVTKARMSKSDREKQIAEQEAENERLRKEQEQRENDLKAANMIRGIRTSDLASVGYSHHSDVAELSEMDFALLLDEQTALFKQKEAEQKAAKEKQDKLEAENKRIADELKQKQDAENKRLADEKKKKADEIAEMKRLAVAGDKEKLEHWLNTFVCGTPPALGSDESNFTCDEIKNKFEAFKTWATSQINKL